MRYLLRAVFACLLLVTGCSDQDLAYPWLNELDDKGDVKHAGKRLMALPEGLHALEPAQETVTTILVGIHGYASNGYEWVYPLKTLDDDNTATYFYRWDFNACPAPSADLLIKAIGDILAESPGVEMVRLLSHSYGGVLATTIVKEWHYATPAEIHVIASPLAGIGALSQQCDYEPPTSIAPSVRFFQWRTQHALDGAFKELAVDPQVFELNGSTVTRLPDTYNGHRLGHNWSISWVADRLKMGRAQ